MEIEIKNYSELSLNANKVLGELLHQVNADLAKNNTPPMSPQLSFLGLDLEKAIVRTGLDFKSAYCAVSMLEKRNFIHVSSMNTSISDGLIYELLNPIEDE